MNLNINKKVNTALAAAINRKSDITTSVKNDNNFSGREVKISIKHASFGPNSYRIKIELNSDNKKTDEEVTIANMIVKGNVVVDFHKEGRFIMSTYPTYYNCILNPLVKRVNAISCIEKKPGE